MARLSYDAPWTTMDAAYFASEAWWTYLTAPFLFTYNGFDTEEVQPFVEAGVSYRTLRVAFLTTPTATPENSSFTSTRPAYCSDTRTPPTYSTEPPARTTPVSGK